MKTKLTKLTSISALLLATALIPSVAHAATLETFTFTKTGYALNDTLTSTKATGVATPRHAAARMGARSFSTPRTTVSDDRCI